MHHKVQHLIIGLDLAHDNHSTEAIRQMLQESICGDVEVITIPGSSGMVLLETEPSDEESKRWIEKKIFEGGS